MDRSFLCLELDDQGITASLAGKGPGQAPYRIRYGDLTDGEEKKSAFDAAMDEVAFRLDLGACSQAVIFVSPLWVSFRTLELPFSSASKIRQVLDFELESLLPLGNEAYVSDFVFLQSGRKSTAKGKPLLTASIAESRVSQYTKKLRSMGIQARLITPQGYAEALAFLGNHPEKENLIFLFFKESFVSLTIFLDKKPRTIRSFPSDGMDAREMTVRVKQAIMGVNQRRGERRFFDILVYADPGPARAMIHELEKQFDPKGIAVAEPDPGELLETIFSGKREKWLFNFCQGEYGASSFARKNFASILAAAVLFGVVFGLFVAGTAMENARMARRIDRFDARALEIFRQTFPDQKKVQDPYLQMKANLRDAVKKTGSDGKKTAEARQFKLVEVLHELSVRIDPSIDMEVSRFLFNNARIVLAGSTDNFNNVDQIKGRIESSDLFRTVEISSAAADKKGNRVNFRFIIEM